MFLRPWHDVDLQLMNSFFTGIWHITQPIKHSLDNEDFNLKNIKMKFLISLGLIGCKASKIPANGVMCSIGGISRDRCQWECRDTRGCEFWTWQKTKNVCYLKKTVSSVNQDRSYDSGTSDGSQMWPDISIEGGDCSNSCECQWVKLSDYNFRLNTLL